MEYFPGPRSATDTNPNKYNNAISFLENGSDQWVINAATNMVKAAGIAAHFALKPIMISIGQTNSPNTAKINEGASPIPKGSAKLKSPFNTLFNFPKPCGNIMAENPILKITNPMSFILGN